MEVIEIKESMWRLDEWEPEYEVGSEGSGSSKVDPPGVRYHVRITLKDKNHAKLIAKEYTNYWLLTKYIWAFEVSDTGQPHLHGAICMPQAYNTGTMSKFMKKYSQLTEGTPGYHHELEMDETKNVAYCCKDQVIVLSNYTECELANVKNKILAIQEDMKAPVWLKLANLLRPKFDNLHYQPEIWQLKIAMKIVYKDIWKKSSPPNFRSIMCDVALELGCFEHREIANNL